MLNVNKPKVSIVIPVYNGANYMRQAIDSALAQTYSKLEVIVINDGSRDDGETERIAMSYGDKIKYFHKVNGGVASALNFGIDNMTGEYFSWLSHDDMYSPDKIESQVNALAECSPDSIAYANYVTINATGKVIKKYDFFDDAKKSMRCFLAMGVEIGLHGCSLLIPKRLFSTYGNFNEELKCTQDYDLWFRFATSTKFIHVDKVLVYSRQHAEQDSKTKTEICTSEADVFHSKAAETLCSDEILIYVDNNICHLLQNYTTYKNAGYGLTAAVLLRIICKHTMPSYDIMPLIEVLNDNIFFVEKKLIERYLQYLKQVLISKAKKRTIVFFNTVWFTGGVERVLSVLTDKLEAKYNIVLITLESNNGFNLNPNVIHFNIGKDQNYVHRVLELTTAIQADIFVGNPNIFVEFISIYKDLRARGIKSIAYNHSYYFLPLLSPYMYSLFESREDAFESANVVTWLTGFSALIYGMSHDNSALMPNPLAFPVDYDSNRLQTHNIKTVLCVGRFYDTIKRLDRVIKVFSEVFKAHSDAKLCLVGGYDLDVSTDPKGDSSIRELISNSNIPESNIIFAGEQRNIEDYYKEASVLILTSEMEGFGMVLAEAGAYGVPAVIFEIPGLEDIITDGVNGYIVPQDNISAMAQKVSYLLTDESVRNNMGNNAKEMVKRFDQQTIADRWTKLIELLLTNDDQKNINDNLNKDFMPDMPVDTDFMRRVVSIYNAYMCQIIAARPGQLKEHIHHLEDFRIQCEELNNQLLAMLSSWSWKITKPLRSICNIFAGK